jgi:hypothetical protein
MYGSRTLEERAVASARELVSTAFPTHLAQISSTLTFYLSLHEYIGIELTLGAGSQTFQSLAPSRRPSPMHAELVFLRYLGVEF